MDDGRWGAPEVFAALVEESDDAIYTYDLDGCVTSWNRGARRLYGYLPEEAIGMPIWRLYPSHLEVEALRLSERIRSGEVVEHLETERLRRDGMLVPVSLTSSAIRDDDGKTVGVLAVARDITEQRMAQTLLSEIELRLRENEALAHVGSWSWDVASGAVQWSEELHALSGVDPLDFEGTYGAHLAAVDAMDRERVDELMRQAAAEATLLDLECVLRRPDGRRRFVYMRARPVPDSAGRVVGLRGICQDVTERRMAEERLRVAAERERRAATELRRADALKDDFLTAVTHELRTPLTVILGFTSLLLSDDVPDEATRRQAVERIHRNADDMRTMVNRLLEFARLQADRVQMHRQELRLAEQVRETVADMGLVLAAHEVRIDVPSTLVVEADPVGLAHVISNLLSNAAKFAPEGSTIEVAARATAGGVELSVTDQGPGIPPELAERIFERFFQLSPPALGPHGTGVGLSIVRQYVELMGGRVWCESGVGRGTTMRVLLLAPGGAPVTGPGGAPVTAPGAPG